MRKYGDLPQERRGALPAWMANPILSAAMRKSGGLLQERSCVTGVDGEADYIRGYEGI